MITVWAPEGVGEIRAGDDLAGELLRVTGAIGSASGLRLADGDIVCVTSKVVSKAEGRLETGDRADALARETRRVVARRGSLAVVVNRLGLTMAAAGVDASNVERGHVLLLPEDPDATARHLRRSIAEGAGVVVGVLVTDTAGRPWREGQTDIAIGAAGLRVVDDHSGRTDPYGNVLAVTAPAVADELAGAAELAAGKLRRRPFVVIRGRADLVLPAEDDGTGAAALLRPEGADLFGLGSREAVLTALRRESGAAGLFGSPLDRDELRGLLSGLLGTEVSDEEDGLAVVTSDPRARWVAEVAAYAHGWEVTGTAATVVRLRPATR